MLCCYEDVRIPNEWCHRLIFTEWWLSKTGEAIPELKDVSPIKIKSAPKQKVVVKIEFILSQDPVNRAFTVDSSGNKTLIAFDEARKLIAEGKAKIKDILIENR